tara:strand:+ start:390 stop:620 length:231 start_codon:yes stop_codon:yes gene_type:complete
MKAKLTERALFARVDRKLQKEGERLRRNREGTRAHDELGSYYVVASDRNTIEATNIDLQKLAKELGVLADWEELEE